MSQTFSARRHGDGSIDFDFYRTRAAALRGQAIRDVAALKLAGAGIAVIVVLLPLIFVGAAATVRLTATALTDGAATSSSPQA